MKDYIETVSRNKYRDDIEKAHEEWHWKEWVIGFICGVIVLGGLLTI